MNSKARYISSAMLLLITSVLVKVIGAVYKIPLTAFIGGVGRGYFAAAYNLYLPLHAVVMGALPIALSRLVSQYGAKDDSRMLASLKRGGGSIFRITGIGGSVLLMLAAKPYATLIAASPKSIYTILVLAPSLLFSCLAAFHRGWYEGQMNMVPTAVSQTIEALLKLVFGLLFARLSMAYLFTVYKNTGCVWGVNVVSEQEALGAVYPFTAAAAMLGATFGSLVSWLYLWAYSVLHRDTRLPRADGSEGKRALLRFSFSIMMSCAVQSVFQFLDTASVQVALKHVPKAQLMQAYAASLRLTDVRDEDLITYVYGLFSASMDFKNLIPGVTMALGVCAVPAICREYEANNEQKLAMLMNAVFKYTALLSVGGGVLMAMCSRDMLTLFYGGASYDMVAGCEKTVAFFAVTAPLYSLASTAVFCNQALGKPERSVLPYIVSGGIRCLLNLLLISGTGLQLYGAVIAGAVGYAVMFWWNYVIAKRLSGVRMRSMNIILKPVVTGFCTCFLTKCLFSQMLFFENPKIKLLIESAIFALIYCILCYFFKVLDFREIFCVLKNKKNGLNT